MPGLRIDVLVLLILPHLRHTCLWHPLLRLIYLSLAPYLHLLSLQVHQIGSSSEVEVHAHWAPIPQGSRAFLGPSLPNLCDSNILLSLL